MKKFSFLVLSLLVLVVFTTNSCLCPPAKEKKPVEKQKVVVKTPKGEVVEAIGQGCDVCSLIKIVPQAPKEAILGQTYIDEVDVIALTNADEVKVMTRFPAELRYIKSEPPAIVDGNRLTWYFGYMKKDQVNKIKVWLAADKEGKHWLCFVPFALPVYCVDTFIGKAALSISKQGPATANLNGEVTYTIVVQNKGTAVARDVVIIDQIPEGLASSDGKNTQTWTVGDMQPNSSKSYNITLKAITRGKVCNVAVARSSNAGEVMDKACTQILKKDVALALNCPQNGFVGKPETVTFGLTNTGDSILTKVVVNIEYPSGVKVTSTTCAAGQPGNQVAWNVGTLNPGAQVNCNAEVVGVTEGTHCVKMYMTSAEGITQTASCCTLWKGVPKLEITKSALATAKLNEEFDYNIVVKNVGTGVARNVVVNDTLPPEVTHPKGAQLQYTIGDLAAGASKTIIIRVKAVQTGTAHNVVKATSENTDPVEAAAKTVIQKMGAQLTVKCPPETFVGKRSSNSIAIANTGGIRLTNIVITAVWSGQLSVVSAEGTPAIVGNQATWNIGSLEPGAEKVFNVVTMSKFAGKECINITATAAEGIVEKASCCTLWKGFPALLLEVIDTEDPLLLGEETTYVIEVTNQGTALDRNIQIVVHFPEQTNPMQAAGDTPGTIQGKKVTFQPYPVLNPKQKIKFTVRSKAVSKGDSRLVVELTSEMLQSPVREEESTQVY